MTRRLACVVVQSLLLLAGACALSQEVPSAQSHDVPIVDGERGDCSVEITVTDSALKPIYKANISVELRYGFGGFHHLDLEVGTNVDGRAKFAGLTDKARMPLEFDVLYEDRQAVVVVNLKDKCHALERAVLPDRRPSTDTPK